MRRARGTRRCYQRAQHAAHTGRGAKTINGPLTWKMSKVQEMVLKFGFLALKNPHSPRLHEDDILDVEHPLGAIDEGRWDRGSRGQGQSYPPPPPHLEHNSG